jgi:hypothetical protein
LSKVHHQKGNADSHGNPQSHADAHPYGYGETHTDRDAHPYGNSETHPYGNSETHRYGNSETHTDGDTHSDGDTDDDTKRYSHPSAERLSAIEFDWSAGAGHQCYCLCPTRQLGQFNDWDRGGAHRDQGRSRNGRNSNAGHHPARGQLLLVELGHWAERLCRQ